MNSHNMQVLTNTIGAVESGGQVYGKQRYDAYTPPFYNTPNEKTITLGWAQNYGYEAKRLIQKIYDIDPSAFNKIDSNGSVKAMLNKDWVAIRWNPTSTQKAILIKLIDSPAGHKAQDELFAELMNKFIADCEKDYTKDIKAIMMYCEIRHLGGKGPVDRIFKRCNGNYSMDNIMASLKKDQNDTSSSNQVGDKKFWSRHKKCYEFINKYAEDEGSKSVSYNIQKVINEALSWVGYLEKKNGNLNYLKSKTANAGNANYTWFGYTMHKIRPATMDYPAPWCDAFVDYCFYTAYGSAGAIYLLGGQFDDYTPNSAQLYKNKGQWHKRNPIEGDQIFFTNGSRICHTGLVYKVDSNTVYTVEGNTSGASGVIANGGGVCKKSYSLNNSRIAGYGRPKYGSQPKGEKYMFEVETIKKGSKGPSVLLMKEIFRARPEVKKSTGIELNLSQTFNEDDEKVLIWYQKERIKAGAKNIKKADGICGQGTWKDLLGL